MHYYWWINYYSLVFCWYLDLWFVNKFLDLKIYFCEIYFYAHLMIHETWSSYHRAYKDIQDHPSEFQYGSKCVLFFLHIFHISCICSFLYHHLLLWVHSFSHQCLPYPLKEQLLFHFSDSPLVLTLPYCPCDIL